MTELLEDEENLQLLEDLVSGNAVSVNISSLSRHLDKHRNTIKKKVEILFDKKIINTPAFPFQALYKIYPLLAVTNIQMPNDELQYVRFEKWVKEDPQIFAAYRVIQGEFDTLLFTYHENITKYQLWRLSIPSILRLDYEVSERYANFPSSTSYFSNQLMLKYNPSAGINLMEKSYEEKEELLINDYALDKLDLEIIRCLTFGKGIKIDISTLCDKTNLHRKTIEKRILSLKKERIITDPVCRFPNFFVPPNYLLTYMLVELKNMNESFLRDIIMDYRVPIAIHTIYGKYNLLMFCNHNSIKDQIRWEENYKKKYNESFISADKTYLSPEMTTSFSHQIVALCYIKNKLQKDETTLQTTIQALKRAQIRVLYDLPI